ncbi:UPF0488 protein CG14286-like [Vespa mandarinia]|uniref:UPF0488 protein CG14286-like n=1 Tax=Vespa mandarinia TaxID=7446 RepID=UPI0016205D46|nr:UPF0488 protein CG14286-like [Vespa mandarinia]
MKPKAKNNKISSKKKNVETNSEVKSDLPSSSVETVSGLNQEAEDQFVLELYWCIQELESSLEKGKVQMKQAQDISKSLNTLKSNSAPLIKKRQIMRNKLGNYREKMIQDEQKLIKHVASVKFTNKPNLYKKSVFLRKASTNVKQNSVKTSDSELNEQSHDSLNNDRSIVDKNSSQEFKFNFQTVT